MIVVRELENAVWCAARLAPALAFQICSQTVRDLIGFDRDDPLGSRQREEAVKRQMREVLRMHPRWTRQPQRAQWVIDNLDAGCESVGERRLVYILKEVGIRHVVTQQRIQTSSGLRYADVSIDGAGVLGEYDGEAKDGGSAKEWFDARTARDRRDKDLAKMNIHVVHVTAKDLLAPAQVLADFFAVASRPLVIDPGAALPAPM